MPAINLTLAFLITQFILLAIIFSGVYVLFSGVETQRNTENPTEVTHNPLFDLPPLFGLFALATLACLVFSEAILENSQPAFGELKLSGLSTWWAFTIVFILDIIGVSFLIFVTGGSRNSPFSSVLFLIPTLAIFLREPPSKFLTYAFLSAVLFLLTQGDYLEERIRRNKNGRKAFLIASLGSLVLSIIVGYATRPQ